MEKLVRLEYLHRDAGNYKDWGSVVLVNDLNLSIEEIHEKLLGICIEGNNFLPSKWGVQALMDSNLPDFELWHEYHCVLPLEECNEVDGRLSSLFSHQNP